SRMLPFSNTNTLPVVRAGGGSTAQTPILQPAKTSPRKDNRKIVLIAGADYRMRVSTGQEDFGEPRHAVFVALRVLVVGLRIEGELVVRAVLLAVRLQAELSALSRSRAGAFRDSADNALPPTPHLCDWITSRSKCVRRKRWW